METKSNTDTNILENNQDIFDDEELSENMKQNILNLSLSENKRLDFLEQYFEIHKNDTIEIVSQLSGMYQFSGTKVLEKYLYNIVFNTNLSLFLKIEASKSLLSFEEFEEDIHDDDDEEFKNIKIESNNAIKERNSKRQKLAYETLNHVCSKLNEDSELSTTFKVEVLCLLMKNKDYFNECVDYFNKIIENINLECDYRYKIILSLENKNLNNFKEYISSFLTTFLNNNNNGLMYRILAAQYILQNLDKENENVQMLLLSFATNENNEYNLRADAADTLLTLGNDDYKSKARDIIIELGKIGGKVRNIFDDAQNVHSVSVEQSVYMVLNTILLAVPTMKINDEEIDINHLEKEINELIKIHNKNKQQEQSIIISLNRIKMDRTLYGSRTLYSILLKLWSYIHLNEHKDEMLKRLLEELEEMSGTCSSGFLSRLINTCSGFGYNVYISYNEQIVSNFCGRLNAKARDLYDNDCEFYKKNMNNILEIYLNHYKLYENKIIDKDNVEMYTLEERIKMFKKDCKFEEMYERKLNEIKEEFCENVLNEMTIESSNVIKRKCFLLFFRTYMPSIREELYGEFKTLISDSEFDLAFRKALSNYDGIKDTL